MRNNPLRINYVASSNVQACHYCFILDNWSLIYELITTIISIKQKNYIRLKQLDGTFVRSIVNTLLM